MKEVFVSTDKAFVAGLPRYVFEGRTVVVTGESEACRAVETLRRAGIVGIDTETRPSFRAGMSHRVALLQAGTEDCCFLFRLCRIGLPPCLVDFLSDASVMKIGLSLKDDFMMLRERGDFVPAGYVELQTLARGLGLQDMSLQKLYANLLDKKISKRARLSNWEAEALSESQIRYAATDAVACLHIYRELELMGRERNFRLVEPARPEGRSNE